MSLACQHEFVNSWGFMSGFVSIVIPAQMFPRTCILMHYDDLWCILQCFPCVFARHTGILSCFEDVALPCLWKCSLRHASRRTGYDVPDRASRHIQAIHVNYGGKRCLLWLKNMASRFRTCVALTAACAVGVLLVAARSWALVPLEKHVALQPRGQSAVETGAASTGKDLQRATPNEAADVTGIDTATQDRSYLKDDVVHVVPNVPLATEVGHPSGLRDCVIASQVFSDDAEVDLLVRVLQQFRDMTPPPDEDGKWVPPFPLVFTQMRKGEGVGIAEAFHHAWSVVLGCGKMFFTKTEVRVRQGKEKCFSLFSSPAAPHLYPWGFFDSATRKQNVPDLKKIIGIRGNLPFGACRFLDPDCSYTTVLLEPVERYISHVQSECAQEPQKFRECDLSLSDFTHAAFRGDISFYGIDNYQTRMLAGDGSVDSKNAPCFSSETCTRTETFKVGPSDLKAAIRNLVFNYPIWGVADDLPNFAQRLQRVYGYPFYMLNKKRTMANLEFGMNLTLDATAKKEIEQMNAADRSLYNFARCVLYSGSPRFAMWWLGVVMNLVT